MCGGQVGDWSGCTRAARLSGMTSSSAFQVQLARDYECVRSVPVCRWAMVADGLSIWKRRQCPSSHGPSAKVLAPATPCAHWPMPTPQYCLNCHIDLEDPMSDALHAHLPTVADVPERSYCSKECQTSHSALGKRKAEAEAICGGGTQPRCESAWWRALTTTASTAFSQGAAPVADAGTAGSASFSFGFASNV